MTALAVDAIKSRATPRPDVRWRCRSGAAPCEPLARRRVRRRVPRAVLRGAALLRFGCFPCSRQALAMPKIPFPRSLPRLARFALTAPAAVAADWLLASSSPQVVPGQRFEVVVIGDGRSADWPPRRPQASSCPPAGRALRSNWWRSASRGGREPTAVFRALADGAHRGGGARAHGKPSARGAARRRCGGQRRCGSPRLLQWRPGPRRRIRGSVAVPAAVAPMAPVAVAPEEAAPVEPSGFGFHEPMYFPHRGAIRCPRASSSASATVSSTDGGGGRDDPGGQRALLRLHPDLAVGPAVRIQSPSATRVSAPRCSTASRSTIPTSAVRSPLSGGYEHEVERQGHALAQHRHALRAGRRARLRLSESGTYPGIAPKAWTYLDREDNPRHRTLRPMPSWACAPRPRRRLAVLHAHPTWHRGARWAPSTTSPIRSGAACSPGWAPSSICRHSRVTARTCSNTTRTRVQYRIGVSLVR